MRERRCGARSRNPKLGRESRGVKVARGRVERGLRGKRRIERERERDAAAQSHCARALLSIDVVAVFSVSHFIHPAPRFSPLFSRSRSINPRGTRGRIKQIRADGRGITRRRVLLPPARDRTPCSKALPASARFFFSRGAVTQQSLILVRGGVCDVFYDSLKL